MTDEYGITDEQYDLLSEDPGIVPFPEIISPYLRFSIPADQISEDGDATLNDEQAAQLNAWIAEHKAAHESVALDMIPFGAGEMGVFLVLHCTACEPMVFTDEELEKITEGEDLEPETIEED